MLPFFYQDNISQLVQDTFTLSPITSHHCVKVLRMETGAQLNLTDGKGSLLTCSITVADRKNAQVKVLNRVTKEKSVYGLTVTVAFTKNSSRNEWMLEKLVELGCDTIIPILTQRSEKVRFKLERWESVLISGMLQSQQTFLPTLKEAISLKQYLSAKEHDRDCMKLIAHCEEDQEKHNISKLLFPKSNAVVMVGPEGDFTPEEIRICKEAGYQPMSLGNNRLRTETAVIYCATIFNAINE